MIDTEQLAREWVRRVRGTRSQRAASKRLGYRSNVVYRWETGRAHPTASTVLSMMATFGLDVRAAVDRFYGGTCSWLDHFDPTSREGAAQLLDDLRGSQTFLEVAAASGFTRHQVARWLESANEPRFADWLALVETLSHRLLDLVAAFFDDESLPCVAEQWQRLVALRRAAYDHPESHLFLRALELDSYQRLVRHQPGFLSRRLGLTLTQERHSLALLEAAGQVVYEDHKWRVADEPFVDTRADAVRSRQLRAHWLRQSAEAVEASTPGTFAFNIFSVSKRDLERARAIHRRYYREMTELIRSSHPNERVVLFATQLYELDRE